MTDAERLALLRSRALFAQINGRSLEKLSDCDRGDPGLFVPPLAQPSSEIRLKRGRGDQKTLFTLCHELGHFWSWATGRRTASYERALHQQSSWESTIASKAHNNDEVMKYPPSKAPEAVYSKAVDDVMRAMPNPLAESDRAEILAEEVRAWCLGFLIAKEVGVDEGTFVAEANTALGHYFPRLRLPLVKWEPADCNCGMTEVDHQFVADLGRVP